MTTPRGDNHEALDREAAPLARSDDETRVFRPDDERTAEHRPPVFPSVGGDAPSRPVPPPWEPPAYTPPTYTPPGYDLPSTGEPMMAPLPMAEPVGGGGRWRWIAAAVATLAVLALIAGFFLFLTPRAGTPSLVALYAPADAAVFGEIRLDFPGDQRSRLVDFMRHFPGFADPASFQQKVDDTLEQAFVSSGSGLSWKNDIDPWFGGQLAVFASTIAPTVGTPPSMTFVFSVEDRARLDALVQSRLAGSGMQQEDYKGQVIWSGNAGGAETRRVSLAVTDEAFIVSMRNEDLKRALDVKADEVPGLADDTFFTQQLAALHTDRLGAFYYDYSTVFASLPTAAAGIPEECLDSIRAAANIKLLGELRAEGDHLALTLRSQIPSGPNLPPAAANSRSVLLEQMPAGALAYVEMRQLGMAIGSGVRQALDCLPIGAGVSFDPRQLEQVLGVSLADYFDFLGDAAVGFTFVDGKVGGGLIATVDDNAVAASRVERILSVIRLMGAGGGTGVKVEEQQHGDVTLNVITFEMGLVQPTPPPPSITVTVANNRLYIGLDNFVVDALDRPAAESLASSERLQAALARAGAENAGFLYVDISGIRAIGEGFLPPAARTTYDTEFKPFIEPLSDLVVVSRTDGAISESDVFLYVE